MIPDRILDEKLGKWAGFEKADQHNLGYYYGEGDARRWGYILPFFTTSLNDCFKWLVPKLISYSLSTDVDGHKATARTKYNGTRSVQATGETPELALCRAIDILVNAEIEEMIPPCEECLDEEEDYCNNRKCLRYPPPEEVLRRPYAKEN